MGIPNSSIKNKNEKSSIDIPIRFIPSKFMIKVQGFRLREPGVPYPKNGCSDENGREYVFQAFKVLYFFVETKK